MFAIRHLFYDESGLTVIQSVVARYHISNTICQTVSKLCVLLLHPIIPNGEPLF